jgi:hypothetical protein
LRLQTTEQAQHIAAGTRPRTPEDNLHAMVGEINAQKLHMQYVQAQLALAKDPLNPAKHEAVTQIVKTMDARAVELYQQQTALNVRQDALRQKAQQDELNRARTASIDLAQNEFAQLPTAAQTTQSAGKIGAKYGIGSQEVMKGIHDLNKPSTVISMTQEKKESQVVGEGLGKQYIETQDAGRAAMKKLNKLDRMDSLLAGVTTGKLTPAMTDIAAIGESFGISIDKTLPAKQAMQALSREMALELRNPAGGAGMPGAMSDQDREFLQSMTPSLSQTNEGNRLIIDTARKVAKRDQEIAKLARTYRQQHEHLDEGFYDQVQAYGDAHPLFTGQNVPQGTAESMTPNVTSEADYNKLPSGATYTAPDGSIRRKK